MTRRAVYSRGHPHKSDALADSGPTCLPTWELGSNNTCRNGNWVLRTRKTRWRSKVYFLDWYPSTSESFLSKTLQFSLGKVCLALQKFNKAQTSHRHAIDAPPTHLVRYKFKEWSTRPVGRLSADCRTTRWPTRWPTQRVGGIGFFSAKYIAVLQLPAALFVVKSKLHNLLL